MKILTMETFFKCFSYNATSHHLSSTEKKVALAAAIVLGTLTLGLTPLLCWAIHSRQRNSCLNKQYKKIYSASINQAKDPWLQGPPTRQQKNAATAIAASHIIKNLYLGNDTGFASASHLPTKGPETLRIDTTNPHHFNSVISLCPLSVIYRDHDFLYLDQDEKQSRQRLEEAFKTHAIEFNYVGKVTFDAPEHWLQLVFDCTFPEDELSQMEYGKDIEKLDLDQNMTDKATRMADIAVEEWFKPIFQKLDASVFGEARTLVHCQQGVSRSASVIAAYLINRFNVTSEQAIAFLRTKRLCVDPKFMIQLKDYEKALRPQE